MKKITFLLFSIILIISCVDKRVSNSESHLPGGDISMSLFEYYDQSEIYPVIDSINTLVRIDKFGNKADLVTGLDRFPFMMIFSPMHRTDMNGITLFDSIPASATTQDTLSAYRYLRKYKNLFHEGMSWKTSNVAGSNLFIFVAAKGTETISLPDTDLESIIIKAQNLNWSNPLLNKAVKMKDAVRYNVEIRLKRNLPHEYYTSRGLQVFLNSKEYMNTGIIKTPDKLPVYVLRDINSLEVELLRKKYRTIIEVVE